MKKNLFILAVVLAAFTSLQAQTEPEAGQWKTWFITSGRDYRLPQPAAYKGEIAQVVARQKALDKTGRQKIEYWNAGSPGYRWQRLIQQTWMSDARNNGLLANMLVSTAIYDATVAAWDSKYAYRRPRPFSANAQIKALAPKLESPSFPCEYSVAAGAAATIIAHYFPAMADSVQRMAQEAMDSRIAAGMAFPSDTRAGFDLGKKIAEKHIESVKDFIYRKEWDGKIPEGPQRWSGKFAMSPYAGMNKTVVLESGSQFRPGPPPDFAADMEELKNFKQTFASKANAFRFADQAVWEELVHQKIFEYNLHLNAPRAARVYALAGIGYYDGFVACWDAKYAYWGIRPDQLDPTFKPLLQSPPFPGYPSGHAAIGSVVGELCAYLFPAESALFRQTAKDGAESRFQAGIHFRTDNEVALELGRKVAEAIIQRAKNDGADQAAGGEKAHKSASTMRK